jgi:hypothetical protein
MRQLVRPFAALAVLRRRRRLRRRHCHWRLHSVQQALQPPPFCACARKQISQPRVRSTLPKQARACAKGVLVLAGEY